MANVGVDNIKNETCILAVILEIMYASYTFIGNCTDLNLRYDTKHTHTHKVLPKWFSFYRACVNLQQIHDFHELF